MTFIAFCECGAQLQVSDQHLGKQARCPACERVLTIGGGSAQLPQPAPTTSSKAAGQPKRPRVALWIFAAALLSPILGAAAASVTSDLGIVSLVKLIRADVKRTKLQQEQFASFMETGEQLLQDQDIVKSIEAFTSARAVFPKQTEEWQQADRGLRQAMCTSKVIEGKRAVFDQVGRGF